MAKRKKLRNLSNRQVIYLSEILNGAKKADAKRKAGYKENCSVTKSEGGQAMRERLLECMNQVGLSEGFIANKIMQGMTAEKLHILSHKGKIKQTIVSPDFEIQHKYLDSTLKIRGDIKNAADVTMNLGIVQIPTKKNETEWNEIDDKPVEIAELSPNNDLNAELGQNESAKMLDNGPTSELSETK